MKTYNYIMLARKVRIYLIMILLAVLTAAAHIRNNMWHDEVPIWQDTVNKSPNKARPNYFLGIVYDKHGETAEAFRYISRAREIDPAVVVKWLVSSSVHSGQTEQSSAQGRPGNHTDSIHQIMRASTYIDKGDFDEALLIVERVLKADPSYTEAYLALARIYNLLGQTDKENETYNLAIARGKALPPMDMVYVNQGLIFGKQGRYKESVVLFKEALKIRSSYEAHFNLSVAFNSMGFYEDAAREYRKALSLRR